MTFTDLDEMKKIIKEQYLKNKDPIVNLRFCIDFADRNWRLTPEAKSYLEDMVDWYRTEVAKEQVKLKNMARALPVMRDELMSILQHCEWLNLERFITHTIENLSTLGIQATVQSLAEMQWKERVVYAMTLYNQLVEELDRRANTLDFKFRPSGLSRG